MEEPISTSVSTSQAKYLKNTNVVQLIQIKTEIPQSDVEQETLIKEIEIGESNAVHECPIQNLEEIAPEIILKDEQAQTAEGETASKWSHNDTVTFLEVLNDVLNSQEEAGGFLSRKNLFSRVTAILNDQGRNIPRAEIEKKYNNMLMTYRRCQQRLIKKGQAPFWPYFKQFGEARIKDARLHNLPSDLNPKVRRKRFQSTPTCPTSSKESAESLSLESDAAVRRFPPNWREKRIGQDKRKMALIEELVKMSSRNADSVKDIRRNFRESDNVETETLALLKREIKGMREEVTGCIGSLKVAVQQLTQLVVSSQNSIL